MSSSNGEECSRERERERLLPPKKPLLTANRWKNSGLPLRAWTDDSKIEHVYFVAARFTWPLSVVVEIKLRKVTSENNEWPGIENWESRIKALWFDEWRSSLEERWDGEPWNNEWKVSNSNIESRATLATTLTLALLLLINGWIGEYEAG